MYNKINHTRDYLMVSIFVLCSLKEYICVHHLADTEVFTHCTQTVTNRMDATPQTIIPRKSNETDNHRLIFVNDNQLRVDLCPDRRFLKISWTSHGIQRKDAKLCYQMLTVQNNILMDTVCFDLPISGLNQSAAMNCWFPMEHFEKGPVVQAWVYQSSTLVHPIFYGSLNTNILDPVNSCEDVCEVVPMHISSQITCLNMASIDFDISTVVKHLSFHTIDNTSCDDDIIRITRQTETRIEYHLNCLYSGEGHIKVLYIVQDMYCLKYQQVRVYCTKGFSTTMQTLTVEQDNIHSFGTFVIFGIISVIVIAAIFFGIIFVAQWIMYLRIKYRRSHRGSKEDSRNASSSFDESVPLDTKTSDIKDTTQMTELYNTQDSQIQQRRSSYRGYCSTTFNSASKKDNTDGKPVYKSMRKSVTMALLEDTNPFYKKKILFLPKPYDHFTHEATKILKHIFDKEAGVTSQCCYDRGIHKHYMTSDRDKWINNMLGDHDRILIFLCFKSLSAPPNEEKYEPMVDEILRYLLLQRITSTRLCKIIYLYFTESPKSIEKTHQGHNFHIHDTDTFTNFVRDVLNYCGRSKDEYPDVVNKILNCRASLHFLKYIGMNGRSSQSKSGKTSSNA